MTRDRMIFVNLAVESAAATRRFFEGLGLSFSGQFRDETTECMRINDQAYAMFLETARFKSFTDRELADSRTQVEMLLTLSCPSREAVDAIVTGAVSMGGRAVGAAEDLGFMYSHSFEDPDGHPWEVMWMDPAHVQS